MRFGAQRYELKRSIANLREWLRIFRTRQFHIWSIPDEQRLDCSPPTHTTTTVQGKGHVLTYISPGEASIKT